MKFEPGWLKKELDAATAEVKSWHAGMRRGMDAKREDPVAIALEQAQGRIEQLEAQVGQLTQLAGELEYQLGLYQQLVVGEGHKAAKRDPA